MVKAEFLSILSKAYRERTLIPFIGAGLSIPFKIPNWRELIIDIADECIDVKYKTTIELLANNGEYWKCIDLIKNIATLNDMDIQEKICERVMMSMKNNVTDDQHNYLDLAKMNFSNILTTNYDPLITKYINNPCVFPQIPYKVKINSQKLFDENEPCKVWHLHGHIGDADSIVISNEKYEEIYGCENYKKIFEIFQSIGTLLFIGFSMDDKYIQNILSNNFKSFNSRHFILLDRPTYKLKKEIKSEYNINVIEYDSTISGHAYAIRQILNSISNTII